jgi:transcriptional regulator with XRE-family HTH domain
MATLPEYLKRTSQTQKAFAERVGVAQSVISDICAGKLWPSREVWAKIADATGADVTPHDHLPRPAESSAAAD